MRQLTTAICLACSLGASVALADSVGDVRTGNAAFGDGRYDAAIESFSRAILAGDLEPEALAITFNNRGVAYSELGDYDRAIKDYQQALALVPKDPTAIKNLRIAHIRRAAAESRLGDQTAALADYNRAIELEPDHPLAYMRRGQLQLDRGDKAAAVADLTRAQQLDPANKDIAALLEDARRAPAAVAETSPKAPPPAAIVAPDPAPVAEPPAAENDYSIDSPPDQSPNATARPAPSPATAAIEPAAGPERPAEPDSSATHRVTADVNLRQGPGNEYPRIGAVARGTSVAVVGERLGWLQIRLASGGTGWIYKKWLEHADMP
jgi:tetratricopeptide (TPR) repeat protein